MIAHRTHQQTFIGLGTSLALAFCISASRARLVDGRTVADAQPLTNNLKVETVASQPAWVIANDEVELAVTQVGAHMAPVQFFRASRAPVQPYYICPWHNEKVEDILVPVLRVIRGDFFCMPFGANAASANGETHPPHGEPAGGAWSLVAHGRTGSVTFLEMSFKPQVRPGTITKWIKLVDGQNVIYTQEILSGFKGAMPLGHHATLAVPEKEGSLRVAASRFAFGMTCPVLFSDPRNREYQSLAIGKLFRDLRKVPLLWQEPAAADATAFPARTGFTDLLAICRRPVWNGTPAWITATVQQDGYLWFALKDPEMLPTTVFWISNRGRQGPPWNGRNRCLGLEDACGFFAEGLKASCEPNVLTRKGIPTAIELSPERPTCVNYIQGVIKIPAGFETVRSAQFESGKVTFFSITGKQVTTAVNWEFLKTGRLL
jgi:hypothetical protein